MHIEVFHFDVFRRKTIKKCRQTASRGIICNQIPCKFPGFRGKNICKALLALQLLSSEKDNPDGRGKEMKALPGI